MRNWKTTSIGILTIIVALAGALILGGCVSIPLPPMDGERTKAGDWGSVKIMVTYVPNIGNIVQSYKEYRKPTQ